MRMDYHRLPKRIMSGGLERGGSEVKEWTNCVA